MVAYGSCTLQKPQLLLLCFACTFIQGTLINGLLPVSVSTLEKRFDLSSFESGFFSAVYNLAVLLTVIPVCHFGSKHRGRCTACGMFLVGLGALLWTLPHWLSQPYRIQNSAKTPELCLAQNISTLPTPTFQDSAFPHSLLIFLLSQFILGVGVAPLYSVAIAYLDENVAKHSSALYLGIFFASAALGPLAGYMMGAQLLKVYGDIGKACSLSYSHVWHNCSCSPDHGSLSSGLCSGHCSYTPMFLFLLSLMFVFTLFPMMASTQVLLRCVPWEQRTLAMGVQWFIVRLFGSIPSSILFGFAIDYGCLYRSQNGSSSHCVHYDTTTLARVTSAGCFDKDIIIACDWTGHIQDAETV